MRILFITSTRIGDAVLSTGILSHLVTRYPDARITIACGAGPAPLFQAVSGRERVIVLDKKPLSLHWAELWVRCVGTLWDLVVDLRSTGISWVLATRARRVLRRDRSKRHRVVQLADVLGLAEAPAPRLWLSPESETVAARRIPAGTPVLALGPTANWPPKMWPAQNFTALVERLTATDGILPGARIAVFGAAWERDQAAGVLDALPDGRGIDLVGGMGLADVAACIARCALFVGNDSGLMHIAAAAGVPTLGLFGPSPADHYAPWGARCAVAQTETGYEALVNAPGFDHRRADNLMGSLSVEAVDRAARALWARRSERAA